MKKYFLPTMFATLNIPGSNNGFERNLASSFEYFERDKAIDRD